MKDYPWFKHYPAGIPHEIDPDKYLSLVDLFESSIERFADLPAFENFDKIITYREIDKLSRDFAAFLQASGLRKGDRIAIQLPNVLQYPVAMFGALRAGLVIVNVNPFYTAREMRDKFQDSEIRAIVILENFAYRLEKISCFTGIEKIIITGVGDMVGGIKGPLINFILRYIKKDIKPYNLPGSISFTKALNRGAKIPFTRPEISRDNIAFLQYTGGTTGVPKAAVLRHKNILANIEQISAWMIPALEDRKEIVVTPLPLYHIFALTVNCFSFFAKGSKNILVTDPRDIPGFIKLLRRKRFTALTGVNTLFNALLADSRFATVNFASLKTVIGGGMSVQVAVSERWKKVTGVPLCEGYGLTESSPVLSCNPIDGTDRPGTIGIPIPGTQIMIADDDGNEVSTGTAGEILARGPQVMDSYWNQPDETSIVFSNGWLRTGDIGFIDSDGFITVVDRKKDMINVSGFNVYPNEIEQVAAMHPGVLEAGACGGVDETGKEFVKLFIVKRDPALSEDDMMRHLRENLARYKIPKMLKFRDSLPKSNIGKILRRELV